MITPTEVHAWARLDKYLHEKFDPDALGAKADIHYDINLVPGSPWLNITAHVFYSAQPALRGRGDGGYTYSIWRNTGDVYEVQHQEVVDENGPLIPWSLHEAVQPGG